MKKTKKKLHLSRESVQNLTPEQLLRANGGGENSQSGGGGSSAPSYPQCPTYTPSCPGTCNTCTSRDCVLSAYFSCWC